MIERRPEAYDVIIKFRFDLGLKAPLVFNERWIERGLVVLPVQIADGGAGIVPRALATRPCSKDGSASQRPKWVQDHVGYASPATFRKCSVNVQRYNLRKATRLHGSNHPTTAQLAHQLKSAHKLISAMRLRDRARREEAAGGKKTFHERAFSPGWLE